MDEKKLMLIWLLETQNRKVNEVGSQSRSLIGSFKSATKLKLLRQTEVTQEVEIHGTGAVWQGY